jgi:hypothetical protein
VIGAIEISALEPRLMLGARSLVSRILGYATPERFHDCSL